MIDITKRHTLYVEPYNGQTRRLAVSSWDGVEVHRDVLDVNDAFKRTCFQKEVVRKVYGVQQIMKPVEIYNGAPDPLEDLADQILWAAVEADKAKGEQQLTTLEQFTTRQLLDESPKPVWLVKNVLVDLQPGAIFGSFKALKTSVGGDLAVSIASATPFLGHFDVHEARRCGSITGESGRHTMSLLMQRICAARDLDPYGVDITWSTEVPRLDHDIDLERLRKFIKDNALEVCFLDPMYLMLGGAAEKAGNIYAMGGVLANLAQVGKDTACTLLMIHHTSRTASRLRAFDPPELGDAAFAGMAEFVRQWISIGRRSTFDPDTGTHELWLSIGGSAGQSGLYAVDVDEGHLNGDFEGRRWDVAVMRASEARQEQSDAKEKVKQAKKDAETESVKKMILSAVAKYPEGETKKVVRDRLGMSGVRFNRPWLELLDYQELVPVTVVKANNRTYEAYKLADEESQRDATG